MYQPNKTIDLVYRVNTKFSLEDIFLWPDETWCYRSEIQEMNHMSDDFKILSVDSPEYNELIDKFKG